MISDIKAHKEASLTWKNEIMKTHGKRGKEKKRRNRWDQERNERSEEYFSTINIHLFSPVINDHTFTYLFQGDEIFYVEFRIIIIVLRGRV